MFFHLLEDVLRNTILITGLVVIMMMMIECVNIESHGKIFGKLRSSRFGQVLLSAFLGVIPGCMGGFASVSLYTHRMISFGALVAMMIASSGDEAFVMLAMVPDKAWWIFLALFAVAVVAGVLVDLIPGRGSERVKCDEGYEIHGADECAGECHDEEAHHHGRHFTWKRGLMFVGIAVFIFALASGHLEHEHEHEAEEAVAVGINLLDEEWMNIFFAALSVLILGVLVFASDHFVEDHLWHHVVCKHLPSIFLWTLGVLAFIGIGLHYIDISGWISDNTALMILLAVLIGIIPESGPHMIFVSLYATGVVPMPVLLASCISQDGHASLPLIAETKRGFLQAKVVNCAVALIVGFASMAFG